MWSEAKEASLKILRLLRRWKPLTGIYLGSRHQFVPVSVWHHANVTSAVNSPHHGLRGAGEVGTRCGVGGEGWMNQQEKLHRAELRDFPKVKSQFSNTGLLHVCLNYLRTVISSFVFQLSHFLTTSSTLRILESVSTWTRELSICRTAAVFTMLS